MAITKRPGKHGRVGWQVVVARYDALTGTKKRYTIGTFPTKREAQQAEREAQGAINSSTLVKRSSLTVAEMMNTWLESKRGHVRENTWHGYRDTVRNHIDPSLGMLPIQALTPALIQQAVNNWKDTHGTRTIHLVIQRLSAACTHAVKLHLLAANPCVGVTLPRDRPADVVVWTEDELARFLVAADTWRFGVLLRLMIETGMRRSEVLGLRWQDVDLEACELKISSTVVRDRDSGGLMLREMTKTDGSRRVILISADLSTRLKDHRKRNMNSLLVFSSRNGTPLQPTMLARALNRLCVAADVPRVHVHGLRHLAATRMLRARVPERIAQQRMGHTSSEMLRRIYQHADADMQREAVAALESLAENLL